MNQSKEESRISSKIFVVLFIILALVIAYLDLRWSGDRIRESDERATQTQEAMPTPTDIGVNIQEALIVVL